MVFTSAVYKVLQQKAFEYWNLSWQPGDVGTVMHSELGFGEQSASPSTMVWCCESPRSQSNSLLKETNLWLREMWAALLYQASRIQILTVCFLISSFIIFYNAVKSHQKQ